MKIKAKLEPSEVAVVTGGSSGIGKAIACELAERGMHVWLLAQRKDLLVLAQNEVESHRRDPSQVIGIVSADVSDLGQVEKAVTFITGKCGPVDLLVNSAGVTHPGYVEKLDINIFNWLMDVNYFGTVYMTKEVLPEMIKRGSGYILNICSLSGIISSFGYTAYGPSKFAVRAFSDTLRQEMKSKGIGVYIIFPTDTDTPQLAYENQYKPPETYAINGSAGFNTPQAMAKSAIKAMERGRYYNFPNFQAKLTYLLTRLSPGLLDFIMDQLIAGSRKQMKNTSRNEA
jgi:3-dehydrosphinganine reductase